MAVLLSAVSCPGYYDAYGGSLRKRGGSRYFEECGGTKVDAIKMPALRGEKSDDRCAMYLKASDRRPVWGRNVRKKRKKKSLPFLWEALGSNLVSV